MYNNKEHNELIVRLLENGTIFVPQKDFEIIKIEEHKSYYQVWYKFKMKLNSRSDQTVNDVGWVKVPFKNINVHLRAEKIKRIKNNVGRYNLYL